MLPLRSAQGVALLVGIINILCITEGFSYTNKQKTWFECLHEKQQVLCYARAYKKITKPA